MDDLKKYLLKHKEAMDVDEPVATLWNRIDNTATGKSSHRSRSIVYRFAAAAAILTAIVLTGIQLLTGKPEKKMAIRTNLPVAPAVQEAPDTIQASTAKAAPPSKKESTAADKRSRSKPTATDERYAMMESFRENYDQLVNYQISSIRSTPVYAERAAYFDDFKIRLKQMDMDEAGIRKIIQRRGISNNLLEQLINVYQQKLEVLQSLQAEINKINERVKLQPDSSNKFYLHI